MSEGHRGAGRNSADDVDGASARAINRYAGSLLATVLLDHARTWQFISAFGLLTISTLMIAARLINARLNGQ